MMRAAMASDDVTVAEKRNVQEGTSSKPTAVAPVLMLSLGLNYGRVKANPLKHLASLLCEKLRAARGGPCNLIQVATELHSRAEDKHKTTMRRIYDVVNVCEGAGVLARTGHRSPERKRKPASDPNVIQRYLSFRRTGKRTLRGGAEIQWLDGSFQNILGESDRNLQIPYQNQKLSLEIEKRQILDRITQKKRLCDTLSMQVTILQNLLDQNQAQCRLYPNTSGNFSSLDAEFSMPRSIEWGSSSSGVASMKSGMDLSISTLDHSTCRGLISPQSPESYCDVDDFICDYFADEQRPCAAKRLHLPFVMLTTTPEANVNISMTGDPSCQVHLELDQNYRLMDHIQVIKMFPEGRVNMQQ